MHVVGVSNLGHLGHFFGGSSGSHPQNKSGCDPDITCSLENSACWHLVSEDLMNVLK